MTSLISFLHTCFMRSYRYGPPAFVFLIGIIFVYSVGPNPVMASYAFSTIYLFIISAVISYALIDMETAVYSSFMFPNCCIVGCSPFLLLYMRFYTLLYFKVSIETLASKNYACPSSII